MDGAIVGGGFRRSARAHAYCEPQSRDDAECEI